MMDAMTEEHFNRVLESVSHAVTMIQYSVQNAVSACDSPFVRLRPRMFPDGNQWCALYGDDLQSGVAGFGATPFDAQLDFDKNWQFQKAARNNHDTTD